MKMKVRDNNAGTMIPAILFIVFIGISSSGLFVGSVAKDNGKALTNDLLTVFNDLGVVSLFGIIFFFISIFLFIYLLKLPKEFEAKVLDIKPDPMDEDKKIIKLLINEGKTSIECECLIEQSCDLEKGQKCYAYVKELNWEVKYLRKLDDKPKSRINKEILKPILIFAFIWILLRIIIMGG